VVTGGRLTVFRITLLSVVAQEGEGASSPSVERVGSMACVPVRRTALGIAITTLCTGAVQLPSSTKAGLVVPLC
jgi:hypothetical protein